MKPFTNLFIILALSLSCSHLPEEGSKPEFTSKLRVKSNQGFGFDVRNHTQAKLRLVKMLHVTQSPEKTYKYLMDKMPRWSDGLESVTYFRGDKKVGYDPTTNSDFQA